MSPAAADIADPATRPAPARTPERLAFEAVPPKGGDLHYSVRRYFVDEFYQRHAAALPHGSRVLDLGGKKAAKRGAFNIDGLPLRVVYANLDPATRPDLLCDASRVPAPDASFDAVILAEVVEHLPDPGATLRECARLLRPGGVLLATAPFMFREHPDPIDVARYAPAWWQASLGVCGFTGVTVERQGMVLSVLAEVCRAWACDLEERGAFWPGVRGPALEFVRWLRRTASEQERAWGAEPASRASAFRESFMLGVGVRAVRAAGVVGVVGVVGDGP